MKNHILTRIILFSFLGCISTVAKNKIPERPSKSIGKIFLYGEIHADNNILKKEIEIWGTHYHDQGLRHLFVEYPFYTSEFLNLWMNAEDDQILDQIYDDWKGTQSHNPVVKEFYKELKVRFPETIFHGTDIGHQYQTTGKRYLHYLKHHHRHDSAEYQRAKEIIEQGKYYYNRERDGIYRENMMVKNFVRAFNAIKSETIMGIYGSAHTGIATEADQRKTVPSMANQLHKIYGDQVISQNLTQFKGNIDPVRTDSIELNGVQYKALYYGRHNLSGFKDFNYREFWRLENAYDDFSKAVKTGDVLPYDNYPMTIETGQVIVIDYTKTDGTSIRKHYISDGKIWRNRPSTEEFIFQNDRALN